MKQYDVIIIGAGASGLFAGATAIQNGHTVAIIDMGATPARKVAVSGGGRCNFTNTAASSEHYFGKNKNFVRGALARFSPTDMLDWAQKHSLKVVEKAPGQYFCTDGANAVVRALVADTKHCDKIFNTTVTDVDKESDCFVVHTTNEDMKCDKIIIATGGISFATLGVSDIGYKIAKKFGHKIIPIRPALCAIETKTFTSELSGVSLPVSIQIERNKICDSMLFTHTGVGGPAIYRATVRDLDNEIVIDLAPDTNMYDYLCAYKQTNGKKSVAGIISQILPDRVAQWVCRDKASSRIADMRDTELRDIANRINHIVISTSDIKLHTLASAEVVRGGVDTADVSSKTMESKLCHGLYFTGEVMDIAGDLGGFNLQWAWASGFTAGNAV